MRCQINIILIYIFLNAVVSDTANNQEFNLELDEVDGQYKEKAVKELGETSENVETSLQTLKDLLKGERKLTVPINDSAFLLKFLRHSKYDSRKAFERIKKYYDFKSRYNAETKNLLPSSLKTVFEEEMVQLLPRRDRKGRRIFKVNVGKWDPSKVSRNDLFRGIMMTLELILLEPKTQVSGVVAIVDFDDLSFKQIFATSPGYAAMVLDLVQDAIPARIGGLRIVNNSYLFNIVFGLLKPFMSQELSDNLFLENADFHRLNNAIGKDSLEVRYGGTLSNNTPYGKLTYQLAEQYRNLFEELNKYGYNSGQLNDVL